jgi:regulator of protease activity HflC (stomatin/prohibitin superfamily)
VILKVIMVFMLIAYCLSGFFIVEKEKVAVRLRFGKIVGKDAQQVYQKGWYFGWPRPIGEVLTVPITQRNIVINDAFWFEAVPGSVGRSLDELPPPRGGLNPEKDGSLLTGEANIIHGQFTIIYKITNAVAYVQHVGSIELADQLVRAAAEEGIVFTVAQADADALIKKRFDETVAKTAIQNVLDALDTGITITKAQMDNSTMPLSVRPAYTEVINAELERATKIDKARRERVTTLNAAAGEAHEPLFKLIHNYELAHATGDTEAAQAIISLLDTAFDRLEIDGLPLGGEAARILSEAKTYRTQVVEQVKAEANCFNSLLELYRSNPQLVRSRLWQRARETIFTGDVETFYTDGQIYIGTNRDPEIRRQKEQQQLQVDQQNPGATP